MSESAYELVAEYTQVIIGKIEGLIAQHERQKSRPEEKYLLWHNGVEYSEATIERFREAVWILRQAVKMLEWLDRRVSKEQEDEG